MKISFHFIFLVIWGNQKCKGAIPIFRPKEIKIKELWKDKLKIKVLWISFTEKAINNKDAKAWTVKYLIAISVKLKFTWNSIRGINLITLISNPSQARNQEFAEIEIRELLINRK